MTRAREISNVLGRNIESTTFTATAGQTAFSITHAAGRIQVYMNGLLLDPTVDWTSDGSTVTLTEGAIAGDELEVVKFDNLAVADAIPRTGHTGTIDFSDATFTPPAGHVVQVVQATSTTALTLTAGGVVWTNAGAALNITPTSASNKILIMNSATGIVNQSQSGSLSLRLIRNLNDGNGDIVTDAYRTRQGYDGSESAGYIPMNWDINYLDSPNTTNQVTYRIQIAQENAGNVRYNDTDGSAGYGGKNWSRSMLIGLEIAG